MVNNKTELVCRYCGTLEKLYVFHKGVDQEYDYQGQTYIKFVEDPHFVCHECDQKGLK